MEGHKAGEIRQHEEPIRDRRELYKRLLALGTRLGPEPLIAPYLETLISQGPGDDGESLREVKASTVQANAEDPIVAQAMRMLDRDCRGYAPGHDFAHELATVDWPQYEFAQGKEGFNLKVTFTEDSPQQTEGKDLTLEGMTRLECEIRRWPPEAEDAIRAETVREIQRSKGRRRN